MLASFFEVDVWLSRQKGEQTQPSGKRRTARGAGGRAGGTDCTGLPVTALLARPVRDRRPTHAHWPRARKPALDDISERGARTTAIVAVKNGVQGLEQGVRSGLRRFSAGAG